MTGKRFPFEASFPEVADRIDYYVEQVFEALTRDPLTSFLVLPRGAAANRYPAGNRIPTSSARIRFRPWESSKPR